MLCVCVGDVMDVVFSVCIVRRGAVVLVYGECGIDHPHDCESFIIVSLQDASLTRPRLVVSVPTNQNKQRIC